MVRISDIDYLNKVNIVCKSLLEVYLTNDFNKSALASAYILFFLSELSQDSINKDKLVVWANSYFKDKLENKSFTKEKDKEVTALFLIYRALSLGKNKKELVNLYNSHVDKQNLFFKNLSYSAIIQYCSSNLKKMVSNYDRNTKQLVIKYLSQKHFNNTLGLQFLCLFNKENKLLEKIKDTINNPTENYESKLYLAISLYIARDSKVSDQELHQILPTIDTPPAILADTINNGDISNYSRTTINSILIPISPFYIASLFYLTNLLKETHLEIISRTYQQKGIFNRAFGWLVGLIMLIPFLWIFTNTILIAFSEGYLLNLKFVWILVEFLIAVTIYTLIVDIGIKGNSELVVKTIFLGRIKTWGYWFLGTLIFLTIILGIIANKLANWPLLK